MQQPNWHEPSEALNHLLSQPWCFNLFKAINIIEQEWAVEDELSTGISNRVLLTPSKEIVFPASEIKSCELISQGRGIVHIETSILGLYGVSAPMPHYVLEQALYETTDAGENLPTGKRTRTFLDIFNHLLYCLLYQVWKKSQLNLQGRGAEQFDEVLNAILSNNNQARNFSTGIASLKTVSASGLTELIKQELSLSTVYVDDSTPHWQQIEEASCLGSDYSVVLGESLILGEQVLTSGGKVVIYIGQLSKSEAINFFPGEKQGEKLHHLLNSQLTNDLPWSCVVDIEQPPQSIQTLGDNNVLLGVNAYLGNLQQSIHRQTFTDRQYKHRLAAA